jgi:adenine-specific DNA-methyltransferase
MVVLFVQIALTSQSVGRDKGEGAASWFGVKIEGMEIKPSIRVRWKTNQEGMERLQKANRVEATGQSLGYVRFLDDFAAMAETNLWSDIGGVQSRSDPKVYVVQTSTALIQRCMLMTTDPGDLVLDPTCGSGTTAYVAEQWGRRWITIDTSRVALALARARIMGARYPYFLLADSPEGQEKEAEIARTKPSKKPTYGNIRHGFVYERVPHITLKSIANNAEIDVIWDQRHPAVASALEDLNAALKDHQTPFKVETGGRAGKTIDFSAPKTQTVKLPSGEEAPAGAMLEWEVPREAPEDWPKSAKKPLEAFWKARVTLQTEIDASIAAKADFEYLYDRPYEDRKKVRVAGPFTVESLSPHRVLGVDENDELLDPNQCAADGDASTPEPETPGDCQEFVEAILENLKTSGVQQAHKSDKIEFSAIVPWPGAYICAEGRYAEGEAEAETEKRAAIFVGPEFGTVSRPDLAGAAREAAEAKFDVLITCAFNYDAHSSEFDKLGYLPVLKARMNADLHMADELKNTGKGNLFVIFGEPDIDLIDAEDGHIQVKINGVDVFDPSTGDVRSDDADGIACWFIDTDYNEESFFVRHAYFLGANDPYKALKTTLKAEINREAWDTLHGDTSRPFTKPASGRIAVKVINHLGDEVMKVFRVG